MDALVFLVLGMIVGFCMADALHRLARRPPRDVALSVTGEHPTREDIEAVAMSHQPMFPCGVHWGHPCR